MKLSRIALLPLLLCAAPPFAPRAQNATPPAPKASAAATATDPARQALNDQLYEAARKCDAAEVKALLDKGADVDAKFRYGATALF